MKWREWSRRRRWITGVVVVWVIGSIGVAASSHKKTTATTPTASTTSTASPKKATSTAATTTQAASSSSGSSGSTGSAGQTSTSSADNPGDPNTPCSTEFTLGGGKLRLVVTTSRPGELVVEAAVNGTGANVKFLRKDFLHVDAGVTGVTFNGVHSVDQIPVVLYTTAADPHGCSVVRQGDPPPVG